MPVTLTVNENSYVDVVYAENYFASRLYSEAWEAASEDNKAKALIMATQRIDRQKLRGTKADIKQKLEMPRALTSYVVGMDRPSVYVPYAVETEVSTKVKDACCEEALALLKGTPVRVELQQQGVKSARIGSTSESYSGTGNATRLYSQEARELLAMYILGSVDIC